MSRRKARELALKVLFQIDMGGVVVEKAFDHIFNEFEVNEKDQGYCRELVQGTLEKLAQIDEVIRKASNEWDISRMANVDRSILRMGLFEIIFREDIPNNVAINEAIELAKDYSTADSGKFINGILGNVAKNLEQFIQASPGV